MAQSPPQDLNREHILKALADLDAGIEHSFGDPTRFQVAHLEKRYAPKAVFRFMHRPRLYVLHGASSGLCRLEPMADRATVAVKEAPTDA